MSKRQHVQTAHHSLLFTLSSLLYPEHHEACHAYDDSCALLVSYDSDGSQPLEPDDDGIGKEAQKDDQDSDDQAAESTRSFS